MVLHAVKAIAYKECAQKGTKKVPGSLYETLGVIGRFLYMRPLRDTDPSKFRLISTRTDEARLWMVPSNNLRKLVGGIVARYQEIFEVEIYAYCFLSNHYHLLVRAPRGNLDEFQENINRELARRMNWKNHRRAKFWSRRYDSLEIKSENDLLNAFLYTNNNPTHHGLVKDSKDWPGLTSHSHCVDEKDRDFSFTLYSWSEGPKTTRHKLKLSVLPRFKELSKEARRREITILLDAHQEMVIQKREEKGEGFLPLEVVKYQTPGSLPQNSSNRYRPTCYTSSVELRREHRKSMRLQRARYIDASMRFRVGLFDTEFPSFTLKPPAHRLPRVIRFQPLTAEFFKTAA